MVVEWLLAALDCCGRLLGAVYNIFVDSPKGGNVGCDSEAAQHATYPRTSIRIKSSAHYPVSSMVFYFIVLYLW